MPVTFQRLFKRRNSSTVSRDHARRPGQKKGRTVFPRVSNRDGPGRASSRLPLKRCDSARAGGGALPVIMAIIRSSRNPRLPQLQPLSARYNLIKKNHKKTRSSDASSSMSLAYQKPTVKTTERGENVGTGDALLIHYMAATKEQCKPSARATPCQRWCRWRPLGA